MTQPARYAVIAHPLQVDVSPADFRPAPEGAAIGDLAPAGPFVCSIIGPDHPEGAYVLREHWHHAPPPGHLVVFHQAVGGGGGGGGSNPLRIILQVAAVVILGPAGLGLEGLALLGATIASSVVIGALVPGESAASRSGSGSASPTYSFQAQGNQARIDEVIPELFGQQNPFPDFACWPYSEFVDGDQYYHALLLISAGEIDIRRISIDDTPLTDFDSFEVVRIGPGQATRAGIGDGVETMAEQTLVATNMLTAIEVASMEMPTNRWVGPFIPIKAEFTAVSVHVDIVLPRGLDAGRSVAWRVQVRQVNDFDQPAGAWVTLAEETYATASVEPVRLSYSYPITTMRPQVRVMRTDDRTTDEAAAHDISWAGLRARLSTPGILFEGATYVAIRVRASEQLSGLTQSRFRVLARRLLPVWNGTTWSAPTFTRNPAWALAYVLKQRGLTDGEIDLQQLLTLANTWQARQDRFDYVFDSVSTVWDALALIARVGRAVPLIRGARYTFWRDQQETQAVAHFGMRDIRRDSFSLNFAMAEDDPVDAIHFEYFDHRRWDWVTVTAQYSGGSIHTWRGDAQRIEQGLPVPSGPGRMRVPGIVGEQHARRTAAYYLADLVYRPHRVSFDTELQGLLPAYGSLTTIQHDVGDFGQGGDVVDWDAGTRALTVSEPLRWTQGALHYVRLVNRLGVLGERIGAVQGANEHEMVLASEPPDDVLFNDLDRERTRYVFGPATNMGALAKPRAIEPRSERVIAMEFVLEDDRVHAADAPWLPGADEQDPIADGSGIAENQPDALVHLTSRTIYDFNNSTAAFEVGVELQFLADGRLRWTRAYSDGAFGGPTYAAGEWLSPQPVTGTAAGAYEIQAWVVGISGAETFTYSGATLGTWHRLNTNRVFGWRNGGEQGVGAIIYLRVQIRERATGEIQGDAIFTLRPTSPPALENPGGA